MTTLNIGVIGTGSIAGCHLDAYAADFRASLVAVADVALDRAQATAAKYGIATAYGSAEELLADPAIDAVSICTPNISHAELAIAAIRAGKHVLVEKPMARTAAEAEALQQVVEAQDKVLQIGFVRRHSTNCRVLKEFIDSGDLGDIYYAKASVVRRAGNPGGWFADKAISGGGPLIDIGVHVFDLAWHLMGSPKATTVSANTYDRLGDRTNLKNMNRYRAASAGAASDVEDLANALIRFENGASLFLESTYSLHAVRDSLNVEVFGDKGGAELEPLQIATEMHDTIVNVTPTLRSASFDLADGFSTEIANFLESALGEAEPMAPVWQGAEVTRILEAVYTSAAEGREVTL